MKEVPEAVWSPAGLLSCKSWGGSHAALRLSTRLRLIHFYELSPRWEVGAEAGNACGSWSCQCVFLCWHVCRDIHHPSISVCESLASLILCVCLYSFRSEGGVCCAAWVCGGGRRARAWRAALPGDLHNGAAASRHWLPRPGGSESCVSQPAGRSAGQPPQCCFALWPGQTDHFFLFALLLTTSAVCICLTLPLSCALMSMTDPLFLSSQGGVKTILSGFHNILSQTDPSFTGLLFLLFFFIFFCGYFCLISYCRLLLVFDT